MLCTVRSRVKLLVPNVSRSAVKVYPATPPKSAFVEVTSVLIVSAKHVDDIANAKANHATTVSFFTCLLFLCRVIEVKLPVVQSPQGQPCKATFAIWHPNVAN